MRPMHAFTLVTLACAASAAGQTALFSNGSTLPDVPALATSNVTTSGVAAPAGGQWSEVANVSGSEANAVAGFSSHLYSGTSSYRFADDFTVPAGRLWRIDAADFFAYQPGAAAAPFAAINIEIWSGPPSQAGSVRLFGDTLTNRLTSVTLTNLYRAFNQAVPPAAPVPDTARRLYRSRVDTAGTWLPAGTYWLTWQYVPTDPAGVVFSPAVTLAGQRTRPAWNALVLKLAGWTPALDAGKPDSTADVPQDFPFLLTGISVCTADYNRDGFTNLDDLGDFITDFYNDPPIPGGVQPAAQNYGDRIVGFGVPCPNAPDARPPFAVDALRTQGYRVGFSPDGTNLCPSIPEQPFPNLDHLTDYITAFYTPGC